MTLFQSSLGAMVDLNGPGHYIEIGNYQISMGNLIVVLVMILLFILALVIPFPRNKDDR